MWYVQHFINIGLVSFFIITQCNVNGINLVDDIITDTYIRRPRHADRTQIPDECRMPLQPRHRPKDSQDFGKPMPQICCPLPNINSINVEAWAKCHPDKFNVSQAKPLQDGENNPSAFSQDYKECLLFCVFNESGLLTPDGSVNEEILSTKIKAEETSNAVWSNIMQPIFKKCIAASKEADSQSQKVCKPGAHEYIKCMSRELFLNCPQDQWNNVTDCVEMKERLEKCPNLLPPRPIRIRRAQYFQNAPQLTMH